MININGISSLEKQILIKLYDNYCTSGEVVNVQGWEIEFNISIKEFDRIIKSLFNKKWINIFSERSEWGGLDLEILPDGMKAIGKKRIDFKNQIKDVKLMKQNNIYELLLFYYNNQKENIKLNEFDINELKKYVNQKETSKQMLVSEWIKHYKPEIKTIINKHIDNNIILIKIIQIIKELDI